MHYFAQELGEAAPNAQGFSGDDGRTSIFDYCAVETHQNWMNNGEFDGGLLNDDQKKLRSTYKSILNLALNNEIVQKGAFYDLQWCNRDNENYNCRFIFSFLRYTKDEVLLFIVNFDENPQTVKLVLPDDALNLSGFSAESNAQLILATDDCELISDSEKSYILGANGVVVICLHCSEF
jgi:hypothetical protein